MSFNSVVQRQGRNGSLTLAARRSSDNFRHGRGRLTSGSLANAIFIRFQENLRYLKASQWQLPVRLPFPKVEILLDEPAQQAVIRGLRDGQRASWTALYDGYSADLWRYVARLIGSARDDVADVVQESFLAAAKSARQFDPDRGTLWAWLTGIAHHQISLYWRQVSRRARLLELVQSQADEAGLWQSGTDPVQEIWERRELVDLVRVTLASLSSDYAMVLTAKYLDEMSLDELTKRQGGTVEAMKSKLARARREFRVRFERMVREPGSLLHETAVEVTADGRLRLPTH